MGRPHHELPGGVLIPSRLTWSTLAPRDGTATGSSYTETGARPGTAEPISRTRLRVQASGGQAEGLDVVAIKGGYPGGVNVAYRRDGEDEDEAWRGWDPPTRMHAWRSVAPDGLEAASQYDVCVLPSSQKVLVAYATISGVVGLKVRTIDPQTWEVSEPISQIQANGPPWHQPTLCVVPGPGGGERVLCLFRGRLWASDDAGATWSLYSRHPFGPDPTPLQLRGSMVYHAGQILLIIEGTASLEQYVSRDLGVTFEHVVTLMPTMTSSNVVRTAAGLLVTYVRAGDLLGRRVGHAYSSLEDADEFVIRSGVTDAAVTWAEPDGLLWCLTQDADDNVPWYALYSEDGGLTWTECQTEASYGAEARTAPWHWGTSGRVTQLRCVHAAGYAMLVHPVPVVTGVTSTHMNKLAVAIMGAWTNVTAQPIEGKSWDFENRSGWNATYMPFDLPGAFGGLFPLTGSATITEDLWLQFESAGTSDFMEWLYPSESLGVRGETEVIVDAGGDPEKGDISFYAQTSDGAAASYRCELWLHGAGFTVQGVSNLGGSTTYTQLADVAVDMTEPIILQIIIFGPIGHLSVRYRRPGESAWTTVLHDHALRTSTFSAAAGAHVGGGHLLANASSAWRWMAGQVYTTVAPGRVGVGADGVYGRPLGPEPIPIPDGWDASTDATWIRAINGPGAFGDELHLPVVYDHGAHHLFPALSPSPATGWEAADEAEQVFAFDLGVNTRIGEALGLYIGHANFRTAVLEYYDGAVWQTAGTLDLAVATGLPCSRQGDTVYPTADAHVRYLWEGELVGGTAVLRSGVFFAHRRRIVENAHGTWTPAGKAAQLRIEGLLGVEPASGTVELWAPSGLLVVYLSAPVRRRYWRVRIPAQGTADGRLKAGIMLAGRIQPWGAGVDWSRSQAWTANRSERRDTHGTSRVRELGPVARSWTFAWNDGVIRRFTREASPDYYALEGALPLAVAEDVPETLAAILRETRSGEVPVVVVDQLPSATVTLTDPTRFLYARLSGSVQKNGWTGDADRVESITADEVV